MAETAVVDEYEQSAEESEEQKRNDNVDDLVSLPDGFVVDFLLIQQPDLEHFGSKVHKILISTEIVHAIEQEFRIVVSGVGVDVEAGRLDAVAEHGLIQVDVVVRIELGGGEVVENHIAVGDENLFGFDAA